MNLFKSSIINIHPVEKFMLILETLFIVNFAITVAIISFQDSKALSISMILFSLMNVLIKFFVLSNKGLNRKVKINES